MPIQHQQPHINISRDIFLAIIVDGRQGRSTHPCLSRDRLIHRLDLPQQIFLICVIVKHLKPVFTRRDARRKQTICLGRELEARHEPAADGRAGLRVTDHDRAREPRNPYCECALFVLEKDVGFFGGVAHIVGILEIVIFGEVDCVLHEDAQPSFKVETAELGKVFRLLDDVVLEG